MLTRSAASDVCPDRNGGSSPRWHSPIFKTAQMACLGFWASREDSSRPGSRT
jgi:hypothetical protein